MQGKIIKGIAGFYYVYTAEAGVYACKAKGIFRKQNIKPLVGDDVEFEITHEEDREGNIITILPRKNTLIRPAVANIDQALVIFAVAKPKPNLHLLDRFLVTMEQREIPAVICFNKEDIVSSEECDALREIYESAGYQILFTSAAKEEGIADLKVVLHGKTSTVAGPSGVGKSSLINLLAPQAQMETGEISEKIDRGKHTTRHSQLLMIDKDSFIMDTPGFTSLYLENMEKEELQSYFPEFAEYEPQCKFTGCSHINEPKCGVKEALSLGKISRQRYDDYKLMYEELKDQKKY
jgi:ribosome biogenesis GTPase / thiamine phosphate phosphatase